MALHEWRYNDKFWGRYDDEECTVTVMGGQSGTPFTMSAYDFAQLSASVDAMWNRGRKRVVAMMRQEGLAIYPTAEVPQGRVARMRARFWRG